MKKTIKISVIVLIVILVVAFIAFFANSLFGNPISRKLAENTAIEYIEENYPDDNCQIKDIYYDFKYEDYAVHIISATNENIDFSLNITPKGEVAGIEYWENPTNEEESATPLTEDELKEFCIKAHNLYAEWFSPANNLVVDWDNTLKIDKREYFEVDSTKITSVEALKTEFAKYFDSEEIDDKIDGYYVMYNGKMYGASELVQGGEIEGMKHKMTIEKNTNTECLLKITSYLDSFEQVFYYRLRVIDGEWKFAGVFHWVTQYDLVLE